MKLIYSAVLCYITCLFIGMNAQKGIVNVPIADLLGQPISIPTTHNTAEKAYDFLPLCVAQTNSTHSARLHQLLFNDIVDILKTVDDEVCIRIAHAYYLIPSSITPQTQYWTLKKNITPLSELTTHNIPLTHVPEPINYADKNHKALFSPEVVTLSEPHRDFTLQKTFSTGTRFTCVSIAHKKKSSTIEVFAMNYTTMREQRIKIPRHKCILDDSSKTPEMRITDYVKLLKKWTLTKNGCIPYVWGGTSFTQTTQGKFKEIIHTTANGDYSFYAYEKDTCTPKSGFDCSGVVIRAAQICGIPYFYKNTATITRCLAPLKPEQTLIAGDLIITPGHVMVVSDIHKNLLIEARSYGHGYGKLHEIPLNQVFEGIETYTYLTDVFFNKKIIKRKDKNGKVRDTFNNLQLFSMMSVWDKK